MRYELYVQYPNQMYIVDLMYDYGKYLINRVLVNLPFEGNIPDLRKEENFNKFRADLKNKLFQTEYHEKKKKEIEERIKLEQQGNY